MVLWGKGVWRTLFASVSSAGDRSSIFSGPVEIVWRTAGHLTPESDGSTLGSQDPFWVNLHHQGGCSCKEQRSVQSHQLRQEVGFSISVHKTKQQLKATQRYFLSHSAISQFISHCESGMWTLFDHFSEAKCNLTIIRATLHPSLRVAHISRSAANERHRYEQKACFEKCFIQCCWLKSFNLHICQLVNIAVVKVSEMYVNKKFEIIQNVNPSSIEQAWFSYRSQYWPV